MRFGKLVARLGLVFAIGAACGGTSKPTRGGSSDPLVMTDQKPTEPTLGRKTAVEPKPLTDTVKKGLAWLAKQQLDNGGWGQGDEAQGMRGSPQNAGVNVADSSMALIAFIRAGHNPRAGEHREIVHKGLGYVLSEVEASDDKSLFVTQVKGTRVQSKIGQYADTFAALMLFTEARGTGRDGVENARIDAALKKIVKKIEKNQRDNGSFDDGGWAPVLSQAMAAKGLNRAAQTGTDVPKIVLERVEKMAKSGASGRGSAGVMLYGTSADVSAVRDDAETKKATVEKMKAAKKKAKPTPEHKSPDVPSDADVAKAQKAADEAQQAAVQSERALIKNFEDPRFVQGFGNNGGEEFLSYLLISETLVQKGGDEWQKWDAAIGKLVGGVQNEDGSWTGHHCITGRTFCTAAALLVLMGDRTPAVQVIAA